MSGDIVARAIAELTTARTAALNRAEEIGQAIATLERLDVQDSELAPPSKLRGGVSMRPSKPTVTKAAARPCGCGPMGRHLLECELGKKSAPPDPKKKGPWGKAPKAHGVPGKPGAIVGEPAAGDGVTCDVCGRTVQKNPGPGGYMKFHRAPCGLPCNGSNLVHLTAEDRADGTHSKKNCASCGKKAVEA